MVKQIGRLALVASVCGLLNVAVFAQTLAQTQPRVRPPSPFDIELLIKQTLAPGLRADAFVQRMQAMFGLLDSDGDGAISEADRQLQIHKAEARGRALVMSQFVSADFNDDGVVTRDEMVLFQRYVGGLSSRRDGAQVNPAELLERRVAALMRADTNNDGRIDWAEIAAYAKKYALPPPWEPDTDTPYRIMRGFDANGDGKTTLEEYSEAMRRRFAEMDSDDDGVISKMEFDAYWQRKGEPAPKVAVIEPSYQEKLATACAPPRPSKDARLIVFNGYETATLSSTAIGSHDATTTTARIVIEPGTEPLYLVVIGWARIIWQFEGAVARVQRLVLAGVTPTQGSGVPAGATGLAPERVTFADTGKCGTFWVNMHERYPDLVRENGKLLFGRAPDGLLSAKMMGAVRLPSGQVAERPKKAEWTKAFQVDESNRQLIALRRGVLHYYAGGVVDIAPASVVAGQPVTAYDVMPEEAGLLQLVIQGALVRDAQGAFVVQRPMQFPGGLGGAHSVRFIVPKGVPRPTGNPGQSRVIEGDALGGKP